MDLKIGQLQKDKVEKNNNGVRKTTFFAINIFSNIIFCDPQNFGGGRNFYASLQKFLLLGSFSKNGPDLDHIFSLSIFPDYDGGNFFLDFGGKWEVMAGV